MEAARARPMPFRESRAVLRRASRCERRGLGEGANQAHRGVEHTCTCQRRRRPYGKERIYVELASCAQGQAGMLKTVLCVQGPGTQAGRPKRAPRRG
mgnify:CR=1 FL=1